MNFNNIKSKLRNFVADRLTDKDFDKVGSLFNTINKLKFNHNIPQEEDYTRKEIRRLKNEINYVKSDNTTDGHYVGGKQKYIDSLQTELDKLEKSAGVDNKRYVLDTTKELKDMEAHFSEPCPVASRYNKHVSKLLSKFSRDYRKYIHDKL